MFSIRFSLLFLYLVFCAYAQNPSESEIEYDSEVKNEYDSEEGIESRIVNGEPAAPNQFPYTARVWSTSGISCGGSILSQEWVVTAAHCIEKNTSYLVCVGQNQLHNCVKYSAKLVIVHPNFIRKSKINDIALIKTAKQLKFSKSVNSINLPPSSRNYPINGTLIVSGWGRTSNGPARTLQYIRVRNLSPTEAKKRGIPINSNQIGSLGLNGGGSCFGDSGGPLASDKTPPTLEGITSYGISNNCKLGLGKVGTRVSKYLTWISQTRSAHP